MYKTEVIRSSNENYLSEKIEKFLNNNYISREELVDIKFATQDSYFYVLIIYER